MKRIITSLCSLMFLVVGYAQSTKIAEWTFESPGGYNTSIPEFTLGDLNYFTRTDGSDILGGIPSFSNIQGNYFFAAANVDPSQDYEGPEFIYLEDININGYTNLEFRVHLAEDDNGSNEDWDNLIFFTFNNNDYVHFNYDIDSSGFNNLIWVEANGNASASNQVPRIDTDYNGLGDGTEITDTFTQFTQAITGTGSLLDIEIEIKLNLTNEDIAIDNIEIWGDPTGGCNVTTTWNGTVWDYGIPNSFTNVVIDADYFSSTDGGSFEACNLDINSGTLRIQGSDYVKVENNITVDGTIILATEASLVQVNDAGTVTVSATGDCVMQKSTTYIDDWFDYTYWSSPVNNETVGSVFAGVPADRIFNYDATNFDDTNGDTFDDDGNDWSIAGPSEILTAGKGYAAVADGFAPLNSIQTFTFNGTFNNGFVTPSVTMSSGANPQHWNFLGNPYPSAIDASLFLGDVLNSSIIGGTIYLWTHNSDPDGAYNGNDALNFTSDDYASYNLTGGVGTQAASSNGSNNSSIPTGIIASGQGFFIEALSTGVATFNNSMRVSSGNDNFYRVGQVNQRNNNQTSDRLWLNLQNEYGAFSQILIGFNEEATNGIDRLYDGKRLSANSFVSFYSLIEAEKFAIQGLAPFSEETVVPIGLEINIEESMEYSISIENIEGNLVTTDIYLKDNLMNLEHNLTDSSYNFLSEMGEFNDRFEIRFSNTLSLNQINTEPDQLVINYLENNTIQISTRDKNQIENLKVFDMLGRQIMNSEFQNQPVINLDLNSLSNGIMIVNITLGDGNILVKKIIN